MLAYDVNFSVPIGSIASAVLMTFQGKLIFKIELSDKILNKNKSPLWMLERLMGREVGREVN